jgi:hypothetical protein
LAVLRRHPFNRLPHVRINTEERFILNYSPFSLQLQKHSPNSTLKKKRMKLQLLRLEPFFFFVCCLRLVGLCRLRKKSLIFAAAFAVAAASAAAATAAGGGGGEGLFSRERPPLVLLCFDGRQSQAFLVEPGMRGFLLRNLFFLRARCNTFTKS